MLQRFFDCFFLLQRTLRLFGILGLRLVIILSLNDTALLLHLCDIQAADFQAAMLQHIILNLVLGGLALRSGQIQLIQIQFYLNILLGV